jgi:hypothetical protein
MKEEDIRPNEIFQEYIRLAKIDTADYFGSVPRSPNNCPVCQNQGEFSFEKSGFRYESCGSCNSLFVNPLPSHEAFIEYYTQAPSVNYWASTFYKLTSESRREYLWKPKAAAISKFMGEEGIQSHRIIDIGGGFGIFAEEITKLGLAAPIIVEPGPFLAKECRDKGFMVVEKFLEDVNTSDLPIGPKFFVCFELFEHLHSPRNFLDRLNKVMSSGDYFLLTTLSCMGIDIATLWENSNSITPPQHILFLNPNAMKALLEEFGFEVKSISTPGKLDIDILMNSKEFIKDRFLKQAVGSLSDIERDDLQQAISRNGLSSHMMAICKKH